MGAVLLTALKASAIVLNQMRTATGSRWRSKLKGVTWENNDVVHSNARLIGKLEWVHKRTHQRMEMDEDQPLQGLHQM